MHEHLTSYKQNPTQKFHKILKDFQKPQKFQENPKPKSKCMKCMKKERLEKHTRRKNQGLNRNPSGEDEWVEGKVFRREKEVFLSREKKGNEPDFTLKLFKENASRWIKDLSRFYQALILNRYCC